MAVKSVSIPDELFIRTRKMGISLSKATQTGLEILLQGGVDSYNQTKSEIQGIRKQLLDERTINDELKNQIDNLKEEIQHLRKKYVLKEEEEEEEKAINERIQAK